MNTIDITPIVNAALALIGAGVSVFLIPWLKKQYVLDFLKQKGFKVDEESVVNAIEAIVKQLNTEGLTIE
jgi:hypothetical protein